MKTFDLEPVADLADLAIGHLVVMYIRDEPTPEFSGIVELTAPPRKSDGGPVWTFRRKSDDRTHEQHPRQMLANYVVYRVMNATGADVGKIPERP